MMIEWLSGKLMHAGPQGVIVDVNGVGYGVEVPLSVICHLPAVGQHIAFHISTIVREDAIRFFGFATYHDRLAFEVLLSLNGVGPKVALAILSTLSISALKLAVATNDGGILESVPGIGTRTAEKIIVELKPKINRLLSNSQGARPGTNLRAESEPFSLLREEASFDFPLSSENEVDGINVIFADIGSALENLGYKDKVIQPLLQKLEKQHQKGDFQELMRLALGELSQGLSIRSDLKAKESKRNAPALDSDLF